MSCAQVFRTRLALQRAREVVQSHPACQDALAAAVCGPAAYSGTGPVEVVVYRPGEYTSSPRAPTLESSSGVNLRLSPLDFVFAPDARQNDLPDWEALLSPDRFFVHKSPKFSRALASRRLVVSRWLMSRLVADCLALYESGPELDAAIVASRRLSALRRWCAGDAVIYDFADEQLSQMSAALLASSPGMRDALRRELADMLCPAVHPGIPDKPLPDFAYEVARALDRSR